MISVTPHYLILDKAISEILEILKDLRYKKNPNPQYIIVAALTNFDVSMIMKISMLKKWNNAVQLYFHSWIYNVCVRLIFVSQVVIPWYSPISIKALFWIKPFIPDIELSQIDVSMVHLFNLPCEMFCLM